MTPEEKALELVDKFQGGYIMDSGFNYQFNHDLNDAKACALIVIDEIINVSKKFHDSDIRYEDTIMGSYWDEVKEEIKKLS